MQALAKEGHLNYTSSCPSVRQRLTWTIDSTQYACLLSLAIIDVWLKTLCAGAANATYMLRSFMLGPIS